MSEGNIFSPETARGKVERIHMTVQTAVTITFQTVSFDSKDTVWSALTGVLEAIEESENAAKIKEARENAGNDMIKRMQYVFPIIMMIQMDVIKDFGFSEGRHGIIQFTQLVRALEREDPEIALLHSQVRSHFLPEVPTSSVASL